jgi:hypothetical protein
VLGGVCAADANVARLKRLELLLRAEFVGHYRGVCVYRSVMRGSFGMRVCRDEA